MCLVAFAINHNPNYPLILIQNRDESPLRPSQQLHRWSDQPDIIAGRDLDQGGTWLGLSQRGRFATLLNHPFTDHQAVNPISRGHLVQEFLASNLSPLAYILKLSQQARRYEGFHLLVSDLKDYYLYSNVTNEIRPLEAGIHTLANREEDLFIKRQDKARQRLSLYLNRYDGLEATDLVGLLQDSQPAESIDSYPDALDYETARQHSALWILGDQFCTVSSTALLVSKTGQVDIAEYSYLAEPDQALSLISEKITL